MSMEIQFQVAQVDSVKAICDLVNSAYRGEGSKRGWTTEADLLGGQRTDEAKITEIITDPEQVILVAHLGKIEDQQIIGCVNLVVNKSDKPASEDKDCHLGLLTVNPVIQGQGLGKLLMKESEVWAQKQKCKSIKMTVITLRKELLSFYERRGFKRTGKLEAFPYGDERFGTPRRPDLQFEILAKDL